MPISAAEYVDGKPLTFAETRCDTLEEWESRFRSYLLVRAPNMDQPGVRMYKLVDTEHGDRFYAVQVPIENAQGSEGPPSGPGTKEDVLREIMAGGHA